MRGPLHQSRKSKLASIINATGDIIHIEDVEKTLAVSRTKAAKLLSRWAAQGLLRRVGSGAYISVHLALHDSLQVIEDPWVLVPALFDPAYIGGRTAAEHWDLTEQIFRDILVYTARPVRQKTFDSQGIVFSLKHVKSRQIFGTRTIWRSQSRVLISDPHRTIIDMLDDPAAGGGIQHVADCFSRYLRLKDCNPQLLIDYAEQLGNGAVFKRLGFLAERESGNHILIEAAKLRLTKGYAKLDPALDCPRLVTRWRLRVPEIWVEKEHE